MNHVVPVTILNRFEQLVNVAAHLVQFNAVGIFFQDLEQVLVKVLEHKVKSVAPSTE